MGLRQDVSEICQVSFQSCGVCGAEQLAHVRCPFLVVFLVVLCVCVCVLALTRSVLLLHASLYVYSLTLSLRLTCTPAASACIVTQQMAICTVFVSFLGENVSAVLAELPIDLGPWQSHAGCLTLALPFFMSLSFIPSLKGLAPVMAAATIMLLVGLALLGVVVEETWEDRPTALPTLAVPQMPLALCAILYSYEG
jgi:hypothetical protein